MSVVTDSVPQSLPPLFASLTERLATVCGVLNVAHAQLVDLVAEALVGDAWCGVGIRSPEHWLAWRTGLSAERARQIVALARRRGDLPVSFAAFSDGELSVDQIAVVARHAPIHNDQEICDVARFATVAQLRSMLAKYPFAVPAPDTTGTPPAPDVANTAPPSTPPTAPAPAPARPADSAWFGWGDNGRFTMHVDCDALTGAIIEQAMLEARDALFRSGRPDVRWIDALSEICNRSLDAIGSPSRRDRYRIYVHLDTNGAWLQQGPALRRDLIDQLSCDAAVVPIWETDGVPVRVGRTRRSPSRHVRQLVLDRDRLCRHPGCMASRHLEIHHVDHWTGCDPSTPGGTTDPERLAALCPQHHDAHHRGEFTITGDADRFDGLQFRLATGVVIEPHGRPRPPDRAVPLPGPPIGHEYQHPTGERLDSRWVFFSDAPLSPFSDHEAGRHDRTDAAHRADAACADAARSDAADRPDVARLEPADRADAARSDADRPGAAGPRACEAVRPEATDRPGAGGPLANPGGPTQPADHDASRDDQRNNSDRSATAVGSPVDRDQPTSTVSPSTGINPNSNDQDAIRYEPAVSDSNDNSFHSTDTGSQDEPNDPDDAGTGSGRSEPGRNGTGCIDRDAVEPSDVPRSMLGHRRSDGGVEAA